MGRIMRRSTLPYVAVYPESVIGWSLRRMNHEIAYAEDYLARCRDLIEQIQRHCDVGNVCPSIQGAMEAVCEYCGQSWEENAQGEPVCCEKAGDEWQAAHAEAEKR